jgi:excisionase family DNA binding protein
MRLNGTKDNRAQQRGMKEMGIDRAAYKPTEVAEALGVHRSRIYQLIKEGSIKTTIVGSRLRIPAAELARIAAEGAPSPEAAVGR